MMWDWKIQITIENSVPIVTIAFCVQSIQFKFIDDLIIFVRRIFEGSERTSSVITIHTNSTLKNPVFYSQKTQFFENPLFYFRKPDFFAIQKTWFFTFKKPSFLHSKTRFLSSHFSTLKNTRFLYSKTPVFYFRFSGTWTPSPLPP